VNSLIKKKTTQMSSLRTKKGGFAAWKTKKDKKIAVFWVTP
jgi:hypothetical protein